MYIANDQRYLRFLQTSSKPLKPHLDHLKTLIPKKWKLPLKFYLKAPQKRNFKYIWTQSFPLTNHCQIDTSHPSVLVVVSRTKHPLLIITFNKINLFEISFLLAFSSLSLSILFAYWKQKRWRGKKFSSAFFFFFFLVHSCSGEYY